MSVGWAAALYVRHVFLMEQPQTLQEVAAAREEWRAALERATQLVAETEKPYHAALGQQQRARTELARTELALKTSARAHFVQQAVIELGVETSEPPVIVVPALGSQGLPNVFELAALAPDGTGLYVHKTTGRRGRTTGKTHAVRTRAVPEELRAAIDRRHEPGGTASKRNEEMRALGLPESAWIDSGAVHRSDELFRWQARGNRDFGGDGPVKPLPPPGGGRWRWLKVREQEELSAVDTAN